MSQRKLTLGEFLPYQLSITSNAVSDLIARSYRGTLWSQNPRMAGDGGARRKGQCDAARIGRGDADGQGHGQPRLQGVVERGLIGRAPNETDGRSHHLALTAVGKELYDQIVPLALSVETEIEGILGNEEATQLAGHPRQTCAPG
jgi:hypothetical protein